MSKREILFSDRIKSIFLYVVFDIIVIDFAILTSVGLWFGGSIPGGIKTIISDKTWQWYMYISVVAPVIKLTVYGLFKFYSKLWKYTTSEELIKVVIAETLIFTAVFCLDSLFLSDLQLMVLPKRLLFASWSFDIVLFIFSRFGYRLMKRFFISVEHMISRKTGSTRVMVVGGGYAGYGVIRSMLNNEKEFKNRAPVIIVDDDINKHNTNINGIRIVKGIDDIPQLANMYEIEEIIIAIPSANNVQLKRILENCNKTDCPLKLLPPINDVTGGVRRHLRDVKITDLLFRDEVNIDVNSISGYLKGRNVLVTGGGGSIGSELCRQIAKFSPNKLIIFDIYENNAYELMNELKAKYPEIDIVIRIGSVRDLDRLEAVFEEFLPKVVFHAAAHKHVSLMQDCPGEAVKNNVFGTLNVAECAEKYDVERFVLLSTDKAVNPTNVMGATKRVTELIIQHMAQRCSTKFMAVRFGNVLGSNGSVVPLFQKQIEEGGPVTVTHPEVVRYFMTIPEASRLVLQAGGIGKSGRIFVLDMGEPVNIDQLARNLIRLSGYIPNKDIMIKYIGLKPGEKLYEELIMADEHEEMKVTYHNKIFVTKPVQMDGEVFEAMLERLKKAAHENPNEVCSVLKEIVPNFNNADNADSFDEVKKIVGEDATA